MAVIPIPTFVVTLENGSFTFVCPLCRKRHYHGSGIEGHREAHCACWPQGYIVKLADPAAMGEGKA